MKLLRELKKKKCYVEHHPSDKENKVLGEQGRVPWSFVHGKREAGGADNQRNPVISRLDNWEGVLREHSRSVADGVPHTDRAWEAG